MPIAPTQMPINGSQKRHFLGVFLSVCASVGGGGNFAPKRANSGTNGSDSARDGHKPVFRATLRHMSEALEGCTDSEATQRPRFAQKRRVSAKSGPTNPPQPKGRLQWRAGGV
jgi:hypothetical protein